MLLRSKLFYCLRLPIYSMLERGEPNPMLGVIKARRVSAASQQTFLLSPAPHPSNAKGRGPKSNASGHESAGDNAASQQTLFIVSGYPSIQC